MIIKSQATDYLRCFSLWRWRCSLRRLPRRRSRTWVSGVGDDVNPCSRTAPCKTFAGAISNTAAGGEINCIDPGGFGAVTITKSITIACEDVEAGITNGGTSGVIVNAVATDVVVLRGLDIDSAPARPVSTGSVSCRRRVACRGLCHS